MTNLIIVIHEPGEKHEFGAWVSMISNDIIIIIIIIIIIYSFLYKISALTIYFMKNVPFKLLYPWYFQSRSLIEIWSWRTDWNNLLGSWDFIFILKGKIFLWEFHIFPYFKFGISSLLRVCEPSIWWMRPVMENTRGLYDHYFVLKSF